jgi:ferrous iron transport protein A
MSEGSMALVADVVVPSDGPDKQLVIRLLELGFVPGERVRMLRRSAVVGGALAVRVGHGTFALRTHEASFILVHPEPQ